MSEEIILLMDLAGKRFIEIEKLKEENILLKELVERAYPIIVLYKYKQAIDKHETDVKWSQYWQEKADKILKKP